MVTGNSINAGGRLNKCFSDFLSTTIFALFDDRDIARMNYASFVHAGVLE